MGRKPITQNSRLIGYNNSLEMDYTIQAKRFCTIANKQVIPLFNALEMDLNEKDIKAAVTNRQTAKALYSAMISDATKKDKTLLRKLLKKTGANEFDTEVAKYGNETALYNYNCFYNTETNLMEIDKEKIHNEVAIILQGDMLSVYERVEAMAKAINAVCGVIDSSWDLEFVMNMLEFNESGKLAPTLNIYKYEGLVEFCQAKSCVN